MAAELPRPGVEVIQVFRSVSPTIITPTLVPNVVGVCRQIVEVLTTTATGGQAVNSDALTPFQAAVTALDAGAGYAGLDGLHLDVSLNHGPDLIISFIGALLSPRQVVAAILSALGAAGIGAYTAKVVGDGWQLHSLAASEFQTIQIRATTSPAVLAAFGFGKERLYTGSSYYTQDVTPVSIEAYPNPRSNLDQLSFEPDSVRAFFFLGGIGSTLLEVLRTESFLRKSTATPAVATGSVDLTTLTYGGGGDLDTQPLPLTINGTLYTVTFVAPANVAAVLAQINAIIGAVATATEVVTSNFLRITTTGLGPAASIAIPSSAGQTTLGLTVATTVGTTAVAAVDDGNGDAVTPLLSFPGENFTAVATEAQIVGTAVIATVTDGNTLIVDDGTSPQTVVFTGAVSSATILVQINALLGAAAGGRTLATVNGSTHLVLTSTVFGDESTMRVVGGTALGELGLVASSARGAPFPPKPGDVVYLDGALFATVTQVAPGGVVTEVKIDKQVPINANVSLHAYLRAKGLSTGLSGRPTPDLQVDALGNLLLKNDILRDTTGTPSTTLRAQLYVQYRAVRRDVTALARSPGLLRFNDTAGVGNQIAPISADNPLALGAYFALLNAVGTQITALGVDAISGAQPFGTSEAFARAATFLEGYEVYGIAPLTHDATVGEIFNTHVTVMSDPVNKGERVVLFNPAVPTHLLDALVGSGTRGQTPPSTTNIFDTGIANLGSLLLAHSVSSVGPLAVDDGVYLDIGDGKKYSVGSVSGAQVTLKVSGFLPGENDDAYFATTTLPSPLIDEAFALRIRGTPLILTDGSRDKDGIALTMQQKGQALLNRRYWQTFPDQCAATLGGIEQIIDGFYMNAAIAGMIGKQPPQQSFTNFPMAGFTRVLGSNDTFSERQLNVMAAGGNYIIVQDDAQSPLISRMALTTDMTSIETRTDSITKVIDFTAKFMRRGLKNFIGRFNITQGFLDSLGHVIQGLGGFLVEAGVLIGFNLNNIVQDESAPDTVLSDSTLDVPFPCNYIRLTLVV